MTYISTGRETQIFDAAARQCLPVLLRGPTGCGKTRFVETMAERLGRPLFTVACHEDLTAGDLVGRYLLKGGETVWEDGPLTRAVRTGGICYLDEVVEARADTTVVIHPLADHRRELNIERLGETLKAPDTFMLVLSYNPGYQSILKEMKPSTRQRMAVLEFGYPDPEIEERIIIQEAEVADEQAKRLVRLGQAIRQLHHEGPSTRTLVTAGKLIGAGLPPLVAAEVAIVAPLSDDPALIASLLELARLHLD